MTSGSAAYQDRVNPVGISIYCASELIRPIALIRGLTAPLTLIRTLYASFVITRVLRATLRVTLPLESRITPTLPSHNIFTKIFEGYSQQTFGENIT